MKTQTIYDPNDLLTDSENYLNEICSINFYRYTFLNLRSLVKDFVKLCLKEKIRKI